MEKKQSKEGKSGIQPATHTAHAATPSAVDLDRAADARRLGWVVVLLSVGLAVGVAGVLVVGQLEQRLLSVEGVMRYAERYHAADWLRDAGVSESVDWGFRWAQNRGLTPTNNEHPDHEHPDHEHPDSAPKDITTHPLHDTAQTELHALFAALFPRPWLEGRLRHLLRAAWPFMTGAADSFSIRLNISPDKAHTEAVLVEHLPKSLLLEKLYEQLTEQAADRILALHLNWPLGLTVSQAELLSMLRDVLPKNWLSARLAQAIGHLTAYLRGDTEHFALLLPVHERGEESALGQQVRGLVLRANINDFLLNHFIRPAVRHALESGTLKLPWGLSLTEEDVVQGFVQVLPEDWLTVQKINIAEQVAMYLLGERNDILIEVNLANRKPAASAALSALVLSKLHDHMPTLPLCPNTSIFRAQFDRTDRPMHCRLQNDFGSRGVLLLLDLHIASRLGQLIDEKIPSSWLYTDAQLETHLGSNTWTWVQTVRDTLSRGFTLTDHDLREQLSSRQLLYFDRTLDIMRHGLPLTSHMLEATCHPDKQPCGWQTLRTYLGLLQHTKEISAALGGLSALGLLGWFLTLRRAGRRRWLSVTASRRWAPRLLGSLSVLLLASAWWLELALELALSSAGRAWAWPSLAPQMPAMLSAMRQETVLPLYLGASLLLAFSLLLSLWNWLSRPPSSPLA